jgi:hypothetical protein
MSYDIRIWTPLEPTPARLRGAWEAARTVEGRDWLISASAIAQVAAEDVPEQIANALPGISYVIELHLEPFDAPASARARLRQIAKQIATAGHGAVEDPQADTVTLGTRVQRLAPLGTSDEATLLKMGFWYESGPMTTPAAAGDLLDVLSLHLPERLGSVFNQTAPDWQAGAPTLGQLTIPPRMGQPGPEFNINPDRKYPPEWPFAPPRSKR